MKESKKEANNKFVKRIMSLQFENLIFKILILIFSVIYLYNSFIKKTGYYDKLRVKELLVEDINGVDRIIISAAISNNELRLRNDTLSGILILNKNGATSMTIGLDKDNIPTILYFD